MVLLLELKCTISSSSSLKLIVLFLIQTYNSVVWFLSPDTCSRVPIDSGPRCGSWWCDVWLSWHLASDDDDDSDDDSDDDVRCDSPDTLLVIVTPGQAWGIITALMLGWKWLFLFQQQT